MEKTYVTFMERSRQARRAKNLKLLVNTLGYLIAPVLAICAMYLANL